MIVTCPQHYLLPHVPLCGGTDIVDIFIKGSCRLGVDVIGQPIVVLCLLLKRHRPLLFVNTKGHSVPSFNQNRLIICGRTLLRTSVSKTCDRFAPDVDSLASYFANKLSSSPDFDSSSSIVPPETGVIHWKTWRVKLSKVRSVLHSLDVNKAVGPDYISPYILKFCCNELCCPICLLFHRVSRSGEVPPSWKVSRITPV